MSKTVQHNGFILISVLGMIMLLSLISAFIAGYAEQRLNQTLELRKRWQQQLDTQATLATLQFVLATRPRVEGGIRLNNSQQNNEPASLLRADSRPYEGIGNTRFALQDEGALLSLLVPDDQRITRLLTHAGVAPATTAAFLDQLKDYTDRDDLRRINGAAAGDYRRAGKPEPPQRFMISPGEVFNLYSGSEWRHWLQPLLPMFTTRSGQIPNLNTMPAAVIASLAGFDEDLAVAIVQTRRERPFMNLEDANQRLGRLLHLNSMGAPTTPTGDLRIQLWNKGACRHPKWIGLSLTPASLLAPWEIDYAIDYTQEQPCASAEKLAVPPLANHPVAGRP